MRKWLYVAWAAVIVMTIVSATFNFIFGWRLGENSWTLSPLFHDGYVYGVLSVAADGFKIAFGILTFAFFMAKGISPVLRTLGVSLCGVIWALATVYALNSAFGSVATNRTDMAGIREAKSTNYEAVSKQLQHVQQQRDWLERHRASATVEGELARERQSHLWTRSAACTDATAADSRTFCQRYYALMAELGTAKRDEELAAQGEKLRQSLASAGGKLVADPHAHFLHELTGFGESAIVLAWMMLLVALVEGGSTLGPVGLYLVRQNMTLRKVAAEAPGDEKTSRGITLAAAALPPVLPRAARTELPVRTDLERKAVVSIPETTEDPTPPPADAAPQAEAPKPVEAVPAKLALVDENWVPTPKPKGKPSKLAKFADIDAPTRAWLDTGSAIPVALSLGSSGSAVWSHYNAFCLSQHPPIKPLNPSHLGRSLRRVGVASMKTARGAKYALRLVKQPVRRAA